MNWRNSFVTLTLFVLVAVRGRGDVIVNNAQPITKRVTVQIVQTAATDGSIAAPLFGTPAQQTAIFNEANQIWAQAGVEIKFKFRASTWNLDFALFGYPGSNNPRPGTDVSTIAAIADQLGVVDPDPTVINVYLVRIVPGFSQTSDNTCNGQSLNGQNGVTLWVGPSTPISAAGRDLVAHILAHEIGHNLGLLHLAAGQNLMQAVYSSGEFLNAAQIEPARSSAFAVTVAEASTKPTLTITAPANQSITLQSGITVQGSAWDARGIAGVTVAGAAATSTDGFSTWTAGPIPLGPGQNALSVVATDHVTPGNTTSVTWNVFYATNNGDADGDGLPDAWEFTNGLNLFDNGSVNPANGALGNPANDGIPNLLKYALNGNPQLPDRSILPVTAIEINPADGRPYLTITYRQLIHNLNGINYIVGVSSDLASWSPDPSNFEEIPPRVQNLDGITESVHLRIKPAINSAGSPTRFVHLKVALP